MKRLYFYLLAIVVVGCNDGDFDVPEFDFTETVSSCGEYTLYKTNSTKTEVISLVLNETQINNIIATNTQHNISSTVKVNYRIVDSAIPTNYFCQSIPPTTPNVVRELNATSGFVIITTEEIVSNSVVTGYKHTIVLKELLFENNNDRIYFETLNFGTLTRTI